MTQTQRGVLNAVMATTVAAILYPLINAYLVPDAYKISTQQIVIFVIATFVYNMVKVIWKHYRPSKASKA